MLIVDKNQGNSIKKEKNQQAKTLKVVFRDFL